jgi:hypothetical protein
MTSNARSDGLDLARDLPTAAEDVDALRRARGMGVLDLEAYLRFLERLPIPTLEALRRRPGPRGARAFVLD